MNYSEKLKGKRNTDSSKTGRTFNEEMESDRGRAINSAAVRRLQQKTQVFPLEKNSAVRSRLTHSLEVQQVGRYIAKSILKKLRESSISGSISGIDGNEEGFISAIEIACLLHDIGNPPFGHFGEEAICKWANEFIRMYLFTDKNKDSKFFKSYGELDGITWKELNKVIEDLCNFEGNAQGLRLLHSLQTLNLTYTQLASTIKYTRAAYEQKTIETDVLSYIKKKTGYYLSEETLLEKIQSELNITKGHRFPFVYIMEAADDISYCIADVEDAVEKGILSIDKLHKSIIDIWREKCPKNIKGSRYLSIIAKKAHKKYKGAKYNKEHEYILEFRTKLINDLVEYVTDRYIKNHNAIFNGSFNEPLLKGEDKYYYATETLRKIAERYVFSAREVEDLELKGYSVIYGLLKIYEPLLKLSYECFKELVDKNSIKGKPIETRLYHKLPSKHISAYKTAVEDININNNIIMELYYRVRLIIDYISGMTDQFALEEFRNLTGII